MLFISRADLLEGATILCWPPQWIHPSIPQRSSAWALMLAAPKSVVADEQCLVASKPWIMVDSPKVMLANGWIERNVWLVNVFGECPRLHLNYGWIIQPARETNANAEELIAKNHQIWWGCPHAIGNSFSNIFALLILAMNIGWLFPTHAWYVENRNLIGI